MVILRHFGLFNINPKTHFGVEKGKRKKNIKKEGTNIENFLDPPYGIFLSMHATHCHANS